MLKGIDVSSNQGKVNWSQVKKAGVQFAILRCHELYGTDAQFQRNYKRCRARGIPVGVYKCAYAINADQARREARDVLKVIKGKVLDYPVFYDIEVESVVSLGSAAVEKIALAFLNEVRDAGFHVGIYCNLDCWKNVLTPRLREYDCWVASYPRGDTGEIVERVRPPKGVWGWQYSENGKVHGIEGTVDMDVLFSGYAEGEKEEPEGVTARDVLDIARGWLGANEADGSHRSIVDLYNAHEPLAQGYEVSYTDSWCDAFVSACFIKAGAVGLIGGTECGVDRHIGLFKAAGIWTEDGTATPEPGDIICFNWDDFQQPNDGFADHIGLVESVADGQITTIEGNCNGRVQRRTIPLSWGYIRGFARPQYADSLPWETPARRPSVS